MISTTIDAVFLAAACVLAAKFIGGFNLVAVALTAGLIGAGLAELYQQMKPASVANAEEEPDDQPIGENSSQSELETTDDRWLEALREFDEDKRSRVEPNEQAVVLQ